MLFSKLHYRVASHIFTKILYTCSNQIFTNCPLQNNLPFFKIILKRLFKTFPQLFHFWKKKPVILLLYFVLRSRFSVILLLATICTLKLRSSKLTVYFMILRRLICYFAKGEKSTQQKNKGNQTNYRTNLLLNTARGRGNFQS